MSSTITYQVVKRSAANAKSQATVNNLALTVQDLYSTVARLKKNGEKPLSELYKEVLENTRAKNYVENVARDIAEGTAAATYKHGKRTIDFNAAEYALNAKTTRELLEEALNSAKSDAQASSSRASDDEEPQQDASGNEEPQQADGVPTQGLPTVSDVQNHVSPDIDNGTPIVNMDEEEEEDEERSEKSMQSDVLCMVEEEKNGGEATVNDALAIYPYWDHKDDWDCLMSDSFTIPTEWKEAVDRERNPASGSGVSPQSTSKREAVKVAQRRLAVTTDIEPRDDDGASSVEESDEEDEDEVSISSSSSRKRKKRRSSGRRKRRKGLSMEDRLIELHRKQLSANKEVMQSEGFKSFVRLANLLLRFDDDGERKKYTLLNFLMIFIDAYSNSREGVVDKNFRSSGYKLSKCTMGTEEKQHKQLRQSRRGFMNFNSRYETDDLFLNFPFGERSGDETLPYSYDRANLKSEYKSSASNSKPIFVLVKKMLKTQPHLLERLKEVMQNSFKDYLDGRYATELLKILTEDDVNKFKSYMHTLLYYHYDTSDEFQEMVKHYHDVLSSNTSRLKLLFTILDTNLEQSREKGSSLVVRGSVVRDNVNLLFKMFQGKKVMMPHAWKSLIKLHLEQSRVLRKQKVSPLTAYLFGHKESFSERTEKDKSYNQIWQTKAFWDGHICHCFKLLSPFLKQDVMESLADVLSSYNSIAKNTKGISTNKYYSVWPAAFKQAAEAEVLHFLNGIPDGRDENGILIQSSDSDSEGEDGVEMTMKNLSSWYMDQYVNGIIQMCTLSEDDIDKGCNLQVASMMLKSVKTLIIMSVARYCPALHDAFLNKGDWQSMLPTILYKSLTEACQVKQGGSTKKKKIFIQNPLAYNESFCIAKHKEEEENKWNQMRELKQHVRETREDIESEDDI